MKIKHATVILTRGGCDRIYLQVTNDDGSPLPTTFPIMNYPTTVKVEAQANYGVEWVQAVFGIDPEVVDVPNSTIQLPVSE